MPVEVCVCERASKKGRGLLVLIVGLCSHGNANVGHIYVLFFGDTFKWPSCRIL